MALELNNQQRLTCRKAKKLTPKHTCLLFKGTTGGVMVNNLDW